MHRIEGDGYITVSGKKYFDDEDLPTRKATQVTYQWANAIQEEIAAVIEAEGGTLNTASETYAQMNQMNTAIDSKVSDEATLRIAADAVVQDQVDDIKRGFIQGLQTGVYFLDSAFISIGAGVALSDDYTTLMEASSGWTKECDAAWAAGTGNGGFGGNDSGPNADTWYYVFMIWKSGSGIDFGFDNDKEGANLLAASTYTKIRRIGAVYWTGTQIRDFYQTGDIFVWKNVFEETLNLSAVSSGFLQTSKDVWAPYVTDEIWIGCNAPGADNVYCLLTSSGTPSGHVGTPSEDFNDGGRKASGARISCSYKNIPTPLSGGASNGKILFEFNTDPASGTITAKCWSWKDRRQKDGGY